MNHPEPQVVESASNRDETIVVEASRPEERLDVFLRAHFPAVTRGAIQRLIGEGHIRVNGSAAKATHHPIAGERIDVHWPEARAAEALPEEMPLDILYEDDDLLVLNKPPGLVVHPGAGHEEHTLVNALLHHCAGKLSGIGGVARPGIVHRLDQDTSGCLVVAKNDATHVALAAQFEARSLQKTYEAIVCGSVGRDAAEINAAIARHPTHRKRMAVMDGGGRAARTGFLVRARQPAATWLEVALHTGRTHQIRVHFQFIGHPIAGDRTYGARQNLRLTGATGYAAPRQMLHSGKLSFVHPGKKEEMTFEAPPPEDFKTALATLGLQALPPKKKPARKKSTV